MTPDATWDDAGEPLNTEAAIADALTWMEMLAVLMVTTRNANLLFGAMQNLARFGDAETQAAYAPEVAA